MMSSRKVRVTSKCNDELPLWLSPYVLVIEWLKETGIWEEVPRQLRVNRQGYQGIDLVMVLLGHRLNPQDWGLKRFLEESAPYGPQLAALAGRKRWPTQSAMSRGLEGVEVEAVDAFAEWLLEQTASRGAFLLSHPGAYYRDCDGEKRRVMHTDGTVEAMRQRALPEGEEMPEPKRYAAGLGAAGYPGRKRGEVQYKVTLMQEAGTSLWVAASWARGNGHFSEAVEALTQTAERWVGILDGGEGRTTVVTDGEAGGVGQAVAGEKSELGFATRLSCYEVLGQKAVRQHLNETQWRAVEDSKSGPTRWAAELGTIRLRDIRVRAVVSRYQVDEGGGNGAGVEIDGWCYELYGFEVDSVETVPAPEAVTLYYGRNAEENRFGQRQREFSSPEVVSFHPGGQYLGIAVALLAWNVETILGAIMEEPLEEVSDEMHRKSRPVPAELAPMPVADDTPATGSTSGSRPPCQISYEGICGLIEDYDWEQRLDDGWEYYGEGNMLLCPRGEKLTYQGARRVAEDRIEVRYFNSYRACSKCPLREDCSRSKKERFRREVTIRIPVDPRKHRVPSSRFEWEAPGAECQTEPEPDSKGETTSPESDKSAQRPPQLVPPVFRRRFRRLASAATIEIIHSGGDGEPRLAAYLAGDAAERQRRRGTWNDRLDWNKHYGKVAVEVTFPQQDFADRLERIFNHDPPTERARSALG